MYIAQSCPTLCNPMDYLVHGISRPEYWSGQPVSSPGGLPNPGMEPRSPALQADSLPAEPQGSPHCTSEASKMLHIDYTSIKRNKIKLKNEKKTLLVPFPFSMVWALSVSLIKKEISGHLGREQPSPGLPVNIVSAPWTPAVCSHHVCL